MTEQVMFTIGQAVILCQRCLSSKMPFRCYGTEGAQCFKCRMDKKRYSNASVQTTGNVLSSKVPKPKSKPFMRKGKKWQQDRDGPTKGSPSPSRKGKEREITSSPKPSKIPIYAG
jgi:hypothetical protein